MDDLLFRHHYKLQNWLPISRALIFCLLKVFCFTTLKKCLLFLSKSAIYIERKQKWKNGLPDEIRSKIGHFLHPALDKSYNWALNEKMANFWPNFIRKAIFPLFIYQKVSKMLEFFQKCQKKFFNFHIEHLTSKFFSDFGL